jgi:hypothetical protein
MRKTFGFTETAYGENTVLRRQGFRAYCCGMKKDAGILASGGFVGASLQGQTHPSHRILVEDETAMNPPITTAPVGSG